jgi:predicted metal-binding membrane protein
MDSTLAEPLSAEQKVILGVLLALAGAAWLALVWQGQSPEMNTAMDALTMGMSAPLFLAIWVLMMVAMMFPTAAPMILAFHKVHEERCENGGTFVSTLIFVAGYLLVWTLAGIAVYSGALAAEMMAAGVALSREAEARIGGIVLIAAGFYQFTPLKELCLFKCRTPTAFIRKSWRDGVYGALHMGLLHGAYCLGCCWLLFVILFPLGLMNFFVMAIITLVVLAEKMIPWPRAVSAAVAVTLAIYGAIVIVGPELLPTFSPGDVAMPAHMPMPRSPD